MVTPRPEEGPKVLPKDGLITPEGRITSSCLQQARRKHEFCFRVRFQALSGPTAMCLSSRRVLGSGARADELESPKYKAWSVFKERRKCRALQLGLCMRCACVRLSQWTMHACCQHVPVSWVKTSNENLGLKNVDVRWHEQNIHFCYTPLFDSEHRFILAHKPETFPKRQRRPAPLSSLKAMPDTCL